MLRRYKHFFHVTLLLIVFTLVLGCTQPEDVAAPISVTNIYMSPVQLPTTPEGYSYELWVVDTAENYYPIDKFLWDNYLYRFYDLDSNRVDTVWSVPYDLLNPFYEYLAVTVETIPDLFPDSAGPVMLRDTIIDPKIWPMLLAFPIDFSFARVTFGMETPTDKDSHSQDASGVWFAFYDYHVNVNTDTFNVTSSVRVLQARTLSYDTTFWQCTGVDAQLNCINWVDVSMVVATNPSYPYDTLIINTTPKLVDTTYWNCGGRDAFGNCVDWIDISEQFYWYDTSISPLSYDSVIYDTLLDTLAISCVVVDTNFNYVPDPLLIDTFTHISVTYENVAFPVNFDTATINTFAVDPCTGNTIFVEIDPLTDYDPNLSYSTSISSIDTLDYFSESFEETADLNGTNWHYKGWVISPYLAPPYQPAECDELSLMTKPAWLPYTVDQYFDKPDEWPVISTGCFKSFAEPDYTPNIYSDNKRVPSFPGEDFIRNLPCGADNYYFADENAPYTRLGDIFITLEPDNFDRNTNFPIVLFITRYHMLSYSMVNSWLPHEQREEDFDMLNIASRVEDSPFGFPGIKVNLVRE